MGSAQAGENLGSSDTATDVWRCPSCGSTVAGRQAIGALACDTPMGTMAVGMDRPIHKCGFMPRFYEAQAMQELAALLKQNVDWRDGRDVQRHLAYGPVVGSVVGGPGFGTDEPGARIWRWIPRQVAYEAGLPEYYN